MGWYLTPFVLRAKGEIEGIRGALEGQGVPVSREVSGWWVVHGGF